MIVLQGLEQCAIAIKELLCYNSFAYEKIRRKSLLFWRSGIYTEEIE